MTNLTLYSVTALLLLDSAGNRIIAKYYSPPAAAAHSQQTAPPPLPPNTPRQLVAQNPFSTLKDQRAFEKTVLEKVAKRGAAASSSGATEIQLLDSNLLLSKSSLDVHLVVVSPAEENELLVSSVLSNLWEAIGMLLAGQGIEKRSLLENLDLITLAVDEAIDDGWVQCDRESALAMYLLYSCPFLPDTHAGSSSRQIRLRLHRESVGRVRMQQKFRSTSRVSAHGDTGLGGPVAEPDLLLFLQPSCQHTHHSRRGA